MDSQVDPDYQVPMAVLSDSQLSFILDCHSETPIYNFNFISGGPGQPGYPGGPGGPGGPGVPGINPPAIIPPYVPPYVPPPPPYVPPYVPSYPSPCTGISVPSPCQMAPAPAPQVPVTCCGGTSSCQQPVRIYFQHFN